MSSLISYIVKMADYYDYMQRMLAIRAFRRRRTFRERIDPIQQYDDIDFLERYRFTKNSVVKIFDIVKNDLTYMTARNNPVSPMVQVLAALRYYATGSFQLVTGDSGDA
ncbi:hypothetical protein KUTeg_003462 [Tegillarca granosa]|uniref:Uncharacterized protein n=1 Tax=Tegillarca granosa TaxID=220873 RepID=A0ABQ9FQE4_TEGGR|nr:hypothetical protein KUTeg_003462 [Tegillarca granosa]